MSDFITADTHFGHANIILHNKRPWCVENPNYDPKRPYNFKTNSLIMLTKDALEQHDTAIVESWNSVVGKNDRVMILGDFAWKNHRHYIQRLKGKKVLIIGNHDNMSNDCLSMMADEKDDGNQALIKHLAKQANRMLESLPDDPDAKIFALEKIIQMAWGSFIEESQAGCIDFMDAESYRHFQEVHEMGCRKLLDLGKKFINKKGFESSIKQDITLSHFAMSSWPSSCWGAWHLYGHSHGRMPEWKNRLCFDVGVDIWGFVPVPIEAVKIKMDMKNKGDGENAPVGGLIKDLDERVRTLRSENLDILRKLGIKYIEQTP